MSTTTRGRGRGGGRGNNRGNSRPPGPNGSPTGPSSTSARRGFSGSTVPGLTQPKAGHGASRLNPTSKSVQKRATDGGAMSGGALADRYNELKRSRETERADAEKRGIVAIPGKARKLADAITPVGTCPDMCPEFERVERAVQGDVWAEEKDPNHSAYAPAQALPMETRMVKTFKRSDAGKGEQLPSDLRPPAVLKQTCDYLFNELLANANSLGQIHHFLWNRTRAIRNDFSIQQVTKVEDVRLAVECYERIARFHIASLHQCATAERPYDNYNPTQEREQLDKTLLSLMQYYDDNRHRLDIPNEPEFRAYCVIFQLRAPEPNLEDRVQSWPRSLAQDPRVQIALKIYAAACSRERRGPFTKYPTAPVIARQDWEQFWKLIVSSQVSYLMACVAEIHFGAVRDMVLKSIVRTSRVGKTVNGKTSGSTDWTMDDLWNLFNFDEEYQLVEFCGKYGLQFQNRDDDGQSYLELGAVAGKALQSPTTPPSQPGTRIVDAKRHGRTLPALIDGLSVRQARAAGLVQDDRDDGEDMGGIMEHSDNGNEGEEEDMDSLFVPETRSQITETKPTHGFSSGAFGKASFAASSTAPSTFGQPSASNGVPSTFGKPSSNSPFGKPIGFGSTAQPTPAFNFTQQKPAAEQQPAPFSFTQQKSAVDEKSTPFSFLNAGASKSAPGPAVEFSTFGKPSVAATGTIGSSPSGGLSSNAAGKKVAQTSPFTSAQPTTSTAPSFFTSKPADANAAASNGFILPSSASLSAPLASTPAPAVNFAPSSAASSAAAVTAPSTFSSHQASAPSNSATSETKSNSAASQSHVAAPTSPSHPPTINNSSGHEASSNTIGAGSRRPSNASVLDTKPKKPSPLSNSFTSFDDGGASARATLNDLGASTENSSELFPDKQSTHFTLTTRTTSSSAYPQSQASDFDGILTRLAHELTHDPVVGFLKQYVEYHVKSVITKTQERLYRERVNKEADDFRTWFLQDKFGKRWRETCRRQRLAKQGRERRKRAHRRLHESQRSDTLDNGSIANAASVLADSVPLVSGSRTRTMVDAMYQSTLGGRLIRSDRQAQAGSTRQTASVTSDASSLARETGHKNRAGHIDDRGRVSKLTVSSDPNADILKRSSFLKFSLASDAPNRGSTTRTPYFRMKALATNLDTDLSRGVKRQREDSIGSSVATPPPRKRPSPPAFSARKSIELGLTDQPSTRSTRSQASDDDDALFARLKAARESLRESGTFMRSEVQKEKESDLKRSIGSGSDSESPSLMRARAEARARAYQADSDFGASVCGREVPAYRNRESRFVPREHYARAIERANSLRASRSADMSRSTSATGQHPVMAPPTQNPLESELCSQPAQPRATETVLTTVNGSEVNNGAFAPLGLFSSVVQEAQAEQLSGFGGTSFAPFDQRLAQGPMTQTSFSFGQGSAASAGFGSNSFQPTDAATSFPQLDSNPFLQAPVSHAWNSQGGAADTQQQSQSFGFGTNSHVPHDNTIQPSQIPKVLSNNFTKVSAEPLGQELAAPDAYDSTTPPLSNSYMPSQAASQAISLLSDGEDEEQVEGDPNKNDTNTSVFGDVGAQQSRHSNNFDGGSTNGNSYGNRFAALADEIEYESDEMLNGEGEDGLQQKPFTTDADSESEASKDDHQQRQPDSHQYDDDDDVSDDGDEDEQEGTLPNGHGYYDEEGSSVETGDIEDDAGSEGSYDGEYDEDEEGSYDEEEDEDDGDRPSGHVPRFGHPPAPRPNPALQVVGNNVEEAIELSD